VGYLSGAKYKLLAYGPADATATLSSLASLQYRLGYLSGVSFARVFSKKAVKPVLLVTLS